MGLGKAPGVWVWKQRGHDWWRINETLNIENGPYTRTEAFVMMLLAIKPIFPPK